MTQDFDFLFAKSKLPKDTVDLGIGENHILREAVLNAFYLKNISFDNLPNIWEYAPPYGYEPLVELLESIYGAKVVITNGAKHGLSAAFYALNETGCEKISYQTPYWASIPSLITREGLKIAHNRKDVDCELIVAPNNPIGFDISRRHPGKPLVHDAAYYTHAYLPKAYDLIKFGDIQIYSMAKMFGLSGCRIGWCVINNEFYYDKIVKFVEATTAGISTPSQRVLLHILGWDQNNPELRQEYEDYVYNSLKNNRSYLHNNLDRKYFHISTENTDIGMFAWIKSKIQDFNVAGVNVMSGAAFGDEDYIRINLAVSFDKIVKAVYKMNKYAKFITDQNDELDKYV